MSYHVLSSIEASPVCIPTSNVEGLQFFHILSNNCYFIFSFKWGTQVIKNLTLVQTQCQKTQKNWIRISHNFSPQRAFILAIKASTHRKWLQSWVGGWLCWNCLVGGVSGFQRKSAQIMGRDQKRQVGRQEDQHVLQTFPSRNIQKPLTLSICTFILLYTICCCCCC